MGSTLHKEQMVLPWMFYTFGYLDNQKLLIKETETLDEIEELCIKEAVKILSCGAAPPSEITTYANLPFFILRHPLKEKLFLECLEVIGNKLKGCWSIEDAKKILKHDLDDNFQYTRVFYMFGLMHSHSLISITDDSKEGIEKICLEIADNWSKMVDIQNGEEEGYPTAYAERVLLEKYGVSNKR